MVAGLIQPHSSVVAINQEPRPFAVQRHAHNAGCTWDLCMTAWHLQIDAKPAHIGDMHNPGKLHLIWHECMPM